MKKYRKYNFLIYIILTMFIGSVIVISRNIIDDWSSGPGPVSSSTASLTYVIIPFAAMLVAAPLMFLTVAAVFSIRAVMTRTLADVIVALVLALPAIAYLAIASEHMKDISRQADAVARIKALDASGIMSFLEQDRYRDNKYALAAIATHPLTSSEALRLIAEKENLELHSRLGGNNGNIVEKILFGWIYASGSRNRSLLGKNYHWWFSVQHLVSLHPNVGPAALTALSRSPDPYVLVNVAMNRSTPASVIEEISSRVRQNNPSQMLSFRHTIQERAYGVPAREAIHRAIVRNAATPEPMLREYLARENLCYALLIAKNAGASNALRNEARRQIPKEYKCVAGAPAPRRLSCSDLSPPNWLSGGAAEPSGKSCP